MENKSKKFNFNATWSMAVGGMVGGGIFSVLGVIIKTAGQWAWLSFLIAGMIALVSAHSYNRLSVKYGKSGGAFTFLNEIDQRGVAGSLSWILILGYILTLSVYAYTFGHYVANIFGGVTWLPRILALSVITVFVFINLHGTGESSKAEIITVWGKLFVLGGLAIIGLVHWNPAQMTAGITDSSPGRAMVGAATIFMAYEGFQLLSYDYDDIENPRIILPKATLSAVISVIIIYILVAIGATMLVGAGNLVENEEVALALAGRKALGMTGLVLVTVAAAFSTGSAINATMFSTARLMESVAREKDLPEELARENKSRVPYAAILIIAVLASALAITGSLGTLVDAASLIFLITFGVVNLLAFMEKVKFRVFSLSGFLGCIIAIFITSLEQLKQKPIPLLIIIFVIILAVIIRPLILKKQ